MIRPSIQLILILSLATGCSIKTKPTSAIDGPRHERAVALNPQNAHARFMLGRIALEERRPSEAIGHFREAIRVVPEFEEAWNGIGLALLEQRRFAAAVTHYSEMVDALPTSVLALEGLATAELGRRRIDEAERQAMAAIARDSASAQAHRVMGEVAYIRADYTAAIRYWTRAIELNPSLRTSLGIQLEDLNNFVRKYPSK
jgi:superkiller protein 3